MKGRLFSVLALVATALLVVACGGREAQMAAPMESAEFFAEEGFAGAVAPEMFNDAVADRDFAVVTGDTAAQQPLPAGQERLIIRTADMSIIVTNTDESLAAIAAMAEANGGWVVNSHVFEVSDSAKGGTITVRVPAEGFDSALDAIAALAVEVEALSTSGQDVTEEYVDLESRLANLEATADRVRDFMDETRNVEEALAVNQELSRLEGEIEVIKGRMQYLSQSAAFSTITAHLTPDELAQPIQVDTWQPGGVFKNAVEALVNALQGLADFLIYFVVAVLPILLIIAIPIGILIWLLRRWRARRRAGDEAAVTAAEESTVEETD